MCTYSNLGSHTHCGMCDAARPSESEARRDRRARAAARRKSRQENWPAFLGKALTVDSLARKPDSDHVQISKGRPEHSPKGEVFAGAADSTTVEEDDCCAICLEPYGHPDTYMTLPCCHRVHIACGDPWILKHSNCPTCRHPTDQYEPIE